MTLTYYVIRCRTTGNIIPLSRGYGGNTGQEPINLAESPKRLPRLFHAVRNARIFLTIWLKGEHRAHYDDDGSLYDLSIRAKPHRKREDMEVVPYNLVIAPDAIPTISED